MIHAQLNSNAPTQDMHRRAHVEERMRTVLDEIYLLGAAHALALFLSERGNARASDDDVREICQLVDRGPH